MKWIQRIGKTTLFFFLPLFIGLITSNPFTGPFTIHLALFFVLCAIALGFVKSQRVALLKTVIQSFVILLLVGGTGWFFSPFFFLLYLFPVYLGFLYAPTVAFGFLAALLIIFGVSVGDVDVSFDILILISLLLVIPLIIYLRKKYLILRQSNKDILILQDDSGIKDSDTIASLLSNRITKLGVTVRQPLSFIKQASQVLLEEDLSPEEATEYLKRIRLTATESLKEISEFEGDTSANEVLKNRREEDGAVSKSKRTIKKP